MAPEVKDTGLSLLSGYFPRFRPCFGYSGLITQPPTGGRPYQEEVIWLQGPAFWF